MDSVIVLGNWMCLIRFLVSLTPLCFRITENVRPQGGRAFALLIIICYTTYTISTPGKTTNKTSINIQHVLVVSLNCSFSVHNGPHIHPFSTMIDKHCCHWDVIDRWSRMRVGLPGAAIPTPAARSQRSSSTTSGGAPRTYGARCAFAVKVHL